METKQGKGKLYLIGSEKFISEIDYKIYQELDAGPKRWWGEFYLDRGIKISEEEEYVVELEGGGKGQCYVKKLVNRVLPGIPARCVYRVNGAGPLK